MATCPRCGNCLDENHRCRGIARLRVRVWATVVGGSLVTAASACGALAWMYARVAPLAIVAAAGIGGVITLAYLRGQPQRS